MLTRIGTVGLYAIVAALTLTALAAWGAEPRTGGELTIALSADADYLDPNMSGHTTAQMLMTHIADNLIRLEAGEFVPQLAQGWEFSEDGRSLTLYLREGIRFHDNTPFNAGVVKLNLERREWSVTSHFLYPQLQEMEIVDDLTLILHFRQPYAPILPHLAHPAMVMLSGEQIEAHLERGQHIHAPIGTGPFVFQEWERGEYLRFTRNPNYWDEGPYVDVVRWSIVPDESTRTVLLETGAVDVIMAVPPLDALVLDGDPGFTVSSTPSIRNIFIGFNVQAPPFDSAEVRRALNYAVDKEAIVEELLMGAGSIADSIVGTGVFGHSAQEPYPYDPDKARQLLADAGYAEGFSATFYHPTGRYLMDVAIAETVQAYLREVGVEIRLVTMEWAAYMAVLRAEVADPSEDVPYDMFMWGWAPGTVDAHHGIRPLLHTASWPPEAFNVGYYSVSNVDELLDKAAVAVDVEDRLALYDQAISFLWEDCPWLFLHTQNFVNAKKHIVKGIEYLGHEHLRVHKAWVDR